MKPWILLWALLSMAGSAAAQALRDPTLPPASVLAGVVTLAVPASSSGTPSAEAKTEPVGPMPVQSFSLEQPLREARDEFEKAYFEFHLAREGGSMTRVAEKTGLERTHLYRKLKQLGVDLTRGKRGL